MDWGDDVSAAIEQGRVHDQLFPLSVEVDDVVDPVIVEELRGRGHNITRESFLSNLYPIFEEASVSLLKSETRELIPVGGLGLQ